MILPMLSLKQMQAQLPPPPPLPWSPRAPPPPSPPSPPRSLDHYGSTPGYVDDVDCDSMCDQAPFDHKCLKDQAKCRDFEEKFPYLYGGTWTAESCAVYCDASAECAGFNYDSGNCKVITATSLDDLDHVHESSTKVFYRKLSWNQAKPPPPPPFPLPPKIHWEVAPTGKHTAADLILSEPSVASCWSNIQYNKFLDGCECAEPTRPIQARLLSA